MHRGSNVPRLGDFNHRVVLDCIRRTSAGVSRVEIAQLTGLSEQTVSTLTRRLLDESLVLEVGREVNGPGKPRTMLGLNASRMFAVGVHFDPVSISVVLIDLAGTVLERARVSPVDDGDPASVVESIGRAVDAVIAAHPPAQHAVMGVGVGAPGPLDTRTGVMINPPLMPAWRSVPLGELLGERVGLPVTLEKDLIAAAAGEAWLRQGSDVPDFLYVYQGAGLGFGLVHDGLVQRGVSHNFGEVGMFLIQPSGPTLPCCTVPGKFSHLVSPGHLAGAARQAGLLDNAGNSLRDLDASIDTLVDSAHAGDARAVGIVRVFAHDLAEGLAPLTDLLDVDEVVLGGHSWARYADLVQPELAVRLGERAILSAARRVHVESSRSMQEAVALGAATTVLDALVSPQEKALAGRLS